MEKIVGDSKTISDILREFGLHNKGGNYKTLKNRLEFDGIDISHIILGHGHNAGKHWRMRKIPLSDVLVENSTYNRGSIKRRLIEDGILQYMCSECGWEGNWKNKPLTLVLDHINGISNDNKIENLRFLCPNCNSQTETFAGRGNRKYELGGIVCPQCGGIKKTRAALVCGSCNGKKPKPKGRKVDRPSKDELQRLIATTPFTTVGKLFGVTDNAVRRWARSYGLSTESIYRRQGKKITGVDEMIKSPLLESGVLEV